MAESTHPLWLDGLFSVPASLGNLTGIQRGFFLSAVMATTFDLQGHRGARGLKPENTLPGFECAFDLGVTTIETDVHLTSDGIPILIHDPTITSRLCRALSGFIGPPPDACPMVSSLTLAQLRGYAADRNPDLTHFPEQDGAVTPLAALFARRQRIDPYTLPTLSDLIAFAGAYAGNPGVEAGKTAAQQARARLIRFDLELKRVPFHPEVIGDGFDGTAPGVLEKEVVKAVRAAGMVDRTTVRSFDNRAVWFMRQLEPGLTAALLVAGTTLLAPGKLVRQADAQIYCPDFQFLDHAQVREAHHEGVTVVPWTVNEPQDWHRLIDWGVDGITTDFPNRLATFLEERGIVWRG
jgi:glycerophosphoryl diester phosphodiesterase